MTSPACARRRRASRRSLGLARHSTPPMMSRKRTRRKRAIADELAPKLILVKVKCHVVALSLRSSVL